MVNIFGGLRKRLGATALGLATLVGSACSDTYNTTNEHYYPGGGKESGSSSHDNGQATCENIVDLVYHTCVGYENVSEQQINDAIKHCKSMDATKPNDDEPGVRWDLEGFYYCVRNVCFDKKTEEGVAFFLGDCNCDEGQYLPEYKGCWR